MYPHQFKPLCDRLKSKLTVDLASFFDMVISQYSTYSEICSLVNSDFKPVRDVLVNAFTEDLKLALIEFYSEYLFRDPVFPLTGLCSYSGYSVGISVVPPATNVLRNVSAPCFSDYSHPIRIGIPLIDSWIRISYALLNSEIDKFIYPVLLRRSFYFIPVVKKWINQETSTKYVVRLGGTSINYFAKYLDELIFNISNLHSSHPKITFPVCLLEFNGQPGVGKSTLAQKVSVLVSNFFSIESYSQLYSRPDERYWSNYQQQLVVLYDDMNQSKKLNFNLGKELIDIGGGCFDSVPMASVEEKGMAFSSVLCLLTTNRPIKSTLDVVPGALDRRFKSCTVTRDGSLVLNAKDGTYVPDFTSSVEPLLLTVLSKFLVEVHSLTYGVLYTPSPFQISSESLRFVYPVKKPLVAYDRDLTLRKAFNYDYLPCKKSHVLGTVADFKVLRPAIGLARVYDSDGNLTDIASSSLGFAPPTISTEFASVLIAGLSVMGYAILRMLH